MNYRHAYHAGNHADVLKHIVLARLVEHLKKKPKPFRAIDLHAGIGLYDLTSEPAQKTGEWQSGVGQFYEADGTPRLLPPAAEKLLEPWRRVIHRANLDHPLRFYPGSPAFIRGLMRPVDVLQVNELHAEDSEALAKFYARDPQVKVAKLDARQAIKAFLPPPERRGLILVDPPYEAKDEIERLIVMLGEGFKRFATGVFCLWYPVTGDGLEQRLFDALSLMQKPGALRAELVVRKPAEAQGLAGSGLVIFNPPWKLDEELLTLLPDLCAVMQQSSDAAAKIESLGT